MIIGNAGVASSARRGCVERRSRRSGGDDNGGRGRGRRLRRRRGSGGRLRQLGNGDGEGGVSGGDDGVGSFSVFIPENLSPHCVEFGLKGLDLLLQRRDCSHAPVNWISKPHVGFVD